MTPHNAFVLDSRPPAPTPTLPEPAVLSDALQLGHPHAAGIALGAAEPWGAVPPAGAPPPVRRCGTCPANRDARADWLLACGVTTVAMASTGGDWMPWFALLAARGVQVLRSDPRQATRGPGRPTPARLAGKGRHRLHTSGRRAGACRPADQVGVLRGSLRHRQRLLTSAAHPLPPRHPALPQMPLTLPPGVRAVTGVPGMASLRALSAGARDPQRRAPVRPPHCHHAPDALAPALPGQGRAAPRCA
jgi:transposase